MIFNIIFAVILFIVLTILMHNIIIKVRTDDDKMLVLCGICAGLVGMLFGTVLGNIVFNI